MKCEICLLDVEECICPDTKEWQDLLSGKVIKEYNEKHDSDFISNLCISNLNIGFKLSTPIDTDVFHKLLLKFPYRYHFVKYNPKYNKSSIRKKTNNEKQAYNALMYKVIFKKQIFALSVYKNGSVRMAAGTSKSKNCIRVIRDVYLDIKKLNKLEPICDETQLKVKDIQLYLINTNCELPQYCCRTKRLNQIVYDEYMEYYHDPVYNLVVNYNKRDHSSVKLYIFGKKKTIGVRKKKIEYESKATITIFHTGTIVINNINSIEKICKSYEFIQKLLSDIKDRVCYTNTDEKEKRQKRKEKKEQLQERNYKELIEKAFDIID